ncbi:MAG: hypothetical protein Q4D79_01680 [Propionibacteriaceae bacterium]|nr:hypothetical protein [Propionibacteriaceae bacterium]
MYVTEAELRDQLRRPSLGAEVRVPAGARLTASATDFVNQWRLVLREVQSATEESRSASASGAMDTTWDKPAEFPVNLAGELPRCLTCGTPLQKKPSALTQVDVRHYAAKSHPRIKLRGRVDSLHALTLMAGRVARNLGRRDMTRDLGTLAAYCRELTSAEFHGRRVAELRLNNWSLDEIHHVTHDPQGTLQVEHLTIDDTDSELQHWLNLARTMSREIEITAMETFPEPDHPYGASICHAFNRLSSAYYFLQLRLATGRESMTTTPPSEGEEE